MKRRNQKIPNHQNLNTIWVRSHHQKTTINITKENRYDLYKNAKETESFVIDKNSLVKFSRSFIYLGLVINFKLSETENVKLGIKKGVKGNGSPQLYMAIKKVTLKAKKNIYKSIAMNLLLWGCENLNGNKTDMERMECFHTKSIQRVMKIKMAQVIEEELQI